MIGQALQAKAMPILLQASRGGPPFSAEDVFVPIALFIMVFGLAWLKVRQRQMQLRSQAEFHKQLLDKFSSGKEFAEFLESKASQQFIAALWAQQPGGFDRLLRSFGMGVVMSAMGLGFLVLAFTTNGRERWLIPAVLLLSIGVGFLVSAAISHRISKTSETTTDVGATPPLVR
jgi:uncharacterized membrane protein